MRFKKAVCFILAALFIFASTGKAGEVIAVIVNRANPINSISESELKKIYTNNILSWSDGTAIIIYELSVQDPLRNIFSQRILEKEAEKAAEEWAHLKLTNQAKNPPVAMKSEALIIRKISREKGAIGYVSLASVRGSQQIKIVTTFE